MKIALITETFLPRKDGVVTRLTATIRWLLDNGHELLIIAPDLGLKHYLGARIEGIPARSFFLYRDLKAAMPTRKVGKILRQFQPDLVHVVNPAILGVAGIYYGRKYRYPMIASFHTNVPKYADYYKLPFLKPILWWFFRTLHNRADLNLCTSQTVKQELTDKRFRNVQLWIRGVDTALFHPSRKDAQMRKRLTRGREDKILLLFVGRLAAEKEIEKIRDVLEASADFCLAIVGDGPYRSFLEQHFAGTDTLFTGFMEGETLASAFASADVFLFPSTTETLGLVLLEAMASGVAVVAARSGPTCEQVEDGVNGLLYEGDQKDSLMITVLKLKDDAFRRQIGENAYLSSQQLGWSRPSEQLQGYYEEVIAQHKK